MQINAAMNKCGPHPVSPRRRLRCITYIEDPISCLSYVVVRGADVPNLVSKLAECLPAFTPAELLSDALEATEHNDQVRAINRLAIGNREWDPAVSTIITIFATEAQNPILREAAVNAMGFRAWPEYRRVLERIAVEDPAENVRQHAANLLAHWPTSPKT
jgi:hypothetical protein